MNNGDEKKLDSLLKELKNDVPPSPANEKEQILAQINHTERPWSFRSFGKVFMPVAAAAALIIVIYSQTKTYPISDAELEDYLSDSYAVLYEEPEPLEHDTAEFLLTAFE